MSPTGIVSRPGASVSFVSDGPISSNSGRNGGKNAGRNYVSALPQRATPVRCRPRFPTRNRRFPDRCRSPDCTSTAFRCRCLLLRQKTFVLLRRRLRNNYILCPTGTPTFAALRRQRRDLIIAHSTSVPAPTLAVVSGSGARGTSSPLNRQCYPPHFMRECIPPNLHDPQRAKGSLNRRFEWFSLVTFFLQKKKVTRAGARNAPSRARRRNTCSPPGRRNTHPAPGIFLSVVGPPTVPAQLSAAASACCGRNLSSIELQPSNISYSVPNGHTYPLRCFAPQWARFDNRHSISAPAPILSLHQRQRRRRYKQSPEPTMLPTALHARVHTAKSA